MIEILVGAGTVITLGAGLLIVLIGIDALLYSDKDRLSPFQVICAMLVALPVTMFLGASLFQLLYNIGHGILYGT